MQKKHHEAVEYLRHYNPGNYEAGIILGTGLGGLVKDIRIAGSVEYSDIPNFPVSTVESHSGKLIFGELSGKKVIAMQGRFHYYEGYSMNQVTFPIHVMKAMGIGVMIASNACGALNPQFRKTDLMVITSHINLLFDTPLKKKQFGFADGRRFYSKRLIELAERTAVSCGIDIQKGSYVPVQGPNLETSSEYRMIRRFGGDTVGMSTIPEVIIANSLGIECLGLSIITDEGFPDTLEVAVLKDIIAAAAVAEPKLTLLIRNLVKNL